MGTRKVEITAMRVEILKKEGECQVEGEFISFNPASESRKSKQGTYRVDLGIDL